MKRNIPAITLAILFSSMSAHCADLPLINVKPSEATEIKIDVRSDGSCDIMMTLSGQTLDSAQAVISANYKKQIAIQVDGIPVSEPVIQIPPPYKGSKISVLCADIDSAAKVIKRLVPAPSTN